MRTIDGWSNLTIEDIADRIMVGIASSATHAYQDTGIIMLRNQNIKEGYIDESDLLHIAPDYEDQHWRKRLKTGDVITVRTGYPGLSAVVPNKFEGAQCFTSLITRPDQSRVSSEYLCYYINSDLGKRFIASAQAGGAQKNVNAGVLKKMPLLLPSISEQRDIVAILKRWDKAIAQTDKLIILKKEQKKGLMQQLLTGKVRFPEFVNSAEMVETKIGRFPADWQITRFGDIFNRVTRKNTVGNNTALTISAQHGLVDQETFFTKRVASRDLSGYYLLKRGEFAYNKSYSAGYPFGALKRLDLFDEGVLSTLYICFGLKGTQNNSNYFTHFFESGGLNRGIYTIAQEGARNHGLLNMSVKDFFNLAIPVPSLQEQQYLAQFFDTVDEEINLLQEKANALRTQKKGLMQQLLTGKIRVNT